MVKEVGGGGKGGSGGHRRECLGRRSLGIRAHAQNEGNALDLGTPAYSLIVIFSLADFLGKKTAHRRHFDG